MADSPGSSQNPSRDASPAPPGHTPGHTPGPPPPGGQLGGFGSPHTSGGFQPPTRMQGYPGHLRHHPGQYSLDPNHNVQYFRQQPNFSPQPDRGRGGSNSSRQYGDGRWMPQTRPTHFQGPHYNQQQQGAFTQFQGNPVHFGYSQNPMGYKTQPSQYGPGSTGGQQHLTPEQYAGHGPQVWLEQMQRGPPTLGFQQVPKEQEPLVVPQKTIRVTGLKPNVSKDSLELYFENERRSGGGDTEKLQIHQDGTALITFSDPQVAARVCSREVHQYSGNTWTVTLHDTSDDSSPTNAIVVSGLNGSVKEETLEMYFESEKRSGGGEIESLRMGKDVAYITFKENGVAQKVASRKHHLGGKDLCVKLEKSAQPRTIAVTGVDPVKDLDTIQMYFESEKKSGGGETEEVKVDKGVIYIRFEEEDVYERVLKRTSHTVAGHTLTVVKAGEEILEEVGGIREGDTSMSPVVEVRGYPLDSSDDSITLYFENKRKSGGGEVEIVRRNDKKGIMLLRFESLEVAKAVVDRKHKLLGHTLQVKLAVPEVTYKDKVLLSCVPEMATEEALCDYLGARTQLDVIELLYGEEEGDVMVSFSEPYSDFAKLSESLKKKPFLKTLLQVSEVLQTTSVTVRKLPDTVSEDQITMYFENSKRSGGGEVEEVTLNKGEKTAVVKFKNAGVAGTVCKRPHKLSGSTVDVSLHFECLGESGGSSEPPCTKIPDPEQLKGVDEYKLKFIAADSITFNDLKNKIENLHGHLDMDLTNRLLTVTPAFTKDHKDAKCIIKTWTDDVTKAVKHLLDAIEVEKIDVNSEIWPDVEPKMNEFRGHSDLKVFTEEQNWLVVVVGLKVNVKDIGDKVKTVVKEVQAESDRRKNQIREKKSFPAGKLRVLVAKGSIQAMNTDYLKLNCDTKSGDVELIGPKEDVQKAVLSLYESVNKVLEQTTTRFSADQRELLRRPSVNLYLEQIQIKQNRCSTGSWHVGKEGVNMYFDSENVFDDMLDFLMTSLSEATVHLDDENVPLLKSHQFQAAVDKLRQDREDRVIINPLPTRRRIQITAVTEDMSYTKRAVENFIQGNTIYTESLTYSQSVTKFIVLHCQDKLTSISEDLKQFCVKFECRGDSTFNITLKATKAGMGQAKMFLKPIADQIKCYSKILSKVGISTFIESGDVLQQVEKNSRCVISKNADAGDLSASQHRSSLDASNQGYDMAFTCTPDTNKSVTVVLGSYVSLADDVDAVVVEATSDIEPNSVQASAVIARAGEEVKEETKRLSRRSGTVLEGEVYSSSSGQLSCKMIIHAVGPTSSTGHNQPGDIINASVITSLEVAAKNHARSVALPSFNNDTIQQQMRCEDCFRSIMDGVKTFFDENSHSVVTKVYLCLEDTKQCQALWSQSVQVFGEERVVAKQSKPTPVHDESPLIQRHRSRQSRRIRDSMNLSGPLSMPADMIPEESEELPPPSAPAPTASVPLLSPMARPRILLVKADMGVEEADVIVTSSNTNLDLNKGMVSRSLLQHAGPAIQTECKAKYPDGIQTGDIAVTKGGDMQCVEQIYHCVLPKWDSNTGKQTLVDTINSLLNKAHQAKWKTMAIPALGTGNLGYSRDLVAQVMYETVRQFGKDHPDTTINDVLFIVYPGDKDSCQVFEAENRKHIEATGGKLPNTLEEVEAEREQEMVAYRENLVANKQRRDNPTPPSQSEPSPGSWFSRWKKYLPWQKAEVSTPDFSSMPRSPSSSDVTLWIFSDDSSNVDKAIDMIYKDMDSHLQTKTVEEKTLKNWTGDQIKQLQDLENNYPVTIKVNKYLGRITITGLLNAMSDAITHIHKLIRDVDKEMQEKQYAEDLKKVVQWYFVDVDDTTGDDTLTAYDVDTNAKLEKAFTKDGRMQLDYGGFTFDFKKWVEYPVDNPDDEVTIMRRDLVQAASSKPPDTWEGTTDDISVKQVAKGTSEYQAIEKNITDSFAGASLEIIRIDRVQNNTLYQQYQAKRHQMENQAGGATQEKLLWHGTKQEHVMNISNYGFNRSYCDKSQNTYGEGVYFTTTAPAAAQDCYAPADSQGKRYLFQSKVLTGSFTKGQPAFKVLPVKDQTKTKLYDSVVDDPANPRVFVLFNDTQAYPEYLITIKC